MAFAKEYSAAQNFPGETKTFIRMNSKSQRTIVQLHGPNRRFLVLAGIAFIYNTVQLIEDLE
jgi:hypothetical protein